MLLNMNRPTLKNTETKKILYVYALECKTISAVAFWTFANKPCLNSVRNGENTMTEVAARGQGRSGRWTSLWNEK